TGGSVVRGGAGARPGPILVAIPARAMLPGPGAWFRGRRGARRLRGAAARFALGLQRARTGSGAPEAARRGAARPEPGDRTRFSSRTAQPGSGPLAEPAARSGPGRFRGSPEAARRKATD